MDWNKQTETMMNAWLDAQRQWWEAWQGTTESANAADVFSPLFMQWQGLMQQSLASWTGNSPIARQVAEQFVASQGAMLRFVELATRAWSEVQPKLVGVDDWSSIVSQYAEQIRAQFDQFHVGTAKATENLNELWALYTEELRRMGMVWAEAIQRAPEFVVFPGMGDGSGVLELTNLYWDAFERTFGGLLESPGLGLTRELNEKIARGFDRWLDFRRASADYQSKLSDVWSEAFEQLMHEMTELSERGKMVSGVRDLLLLWGQVADRVFIETFRTDEYVQIQGQMLNAAMAYRVQVREIMEYVLNALDLPTRSEVDEAHRNIYELRREVKALKKELATLKKPARKPTTRRKSKAVAAPDTAAETTEEAQP